MVAWDLKRRPGFCETAECYRISLGGDKSLLELIEITVVPFDKLHLKSTEFYF